MNALFEAAADLFIMKALAGRARDWLDAESIIKRRPGLDSAYILKHLTELSELKNAPEMLDRALRLLGLEQ